MAQKTSYSRKANDFILNAIARSVIAIALALPYRARLSFVGWFFARILGPLSGAHKRIRNNIEYVWPDMPADQRACLDAEVLDNMGRGWIETYSPEGFSEAIRCITPRGPGLAALDQAKADGRPIILVSGHFGNCHAARGLVQARGHQVGALYRDMSNPYFNPHYVEALASVARPMFPRGRRGLAEMVKFLRAGNTVALLPDQYFRQGHPIRFFGKPAATALSATEMALKYKAVLIPVYGTRLPDGVNFDVYFEDPIPHSDAVTMMQQVTDSLEKQIRKAPGQWLWVHKRWKPERALPTKIDTSV